MIIGNIICDNQESVEKFVYEAGVVHKVLYSLLNRSDFELETCSFHYEFVSAFINFLAHFENYDYICNSIDENLEKRLFYLLSFTLDREEFVIHLVELMYAWNSKHQQKLSLDL